LKKGQKQKCPNFITDPTLFSTFLSGTFKVDFSSKSP
jgi:hypothetical protein